MPAKPSVNKCDDHNSMVNRHIGTAYDNVRIVAENIEAVIEVSEGIDVVTLYLGAFATPPTEGWNGAPLVSGNFYLNTTTNTVDYYDADDMEWIAVDAETVVEAAQTAVAARDAALLAQAAAELAETNAESSAAAALASENAAALSETNALASENAAAQSESNASASESAAATSEANALASENASAASEAAAAQSESNAATSATNAANSASAASTSETNASASEAAAANSAVVAAGYAADAEAAFDNFTDRYLGAFAVDPTTDNDGNPLLVGASYWNTTTNDLRFWNGAAWDVPEQTASQAAQDALAYRDDAQISETNAANSAAAAALSETNALASENAAATSASNAATSETNAATSASDAATSASNAATSESNAATSAADAQQSADDAAAIVPALQADIDSKISATDQSVITDADTLFANGDHRILNLSNSNVNGLTGTRSLLHMQTTQGGFQLAARTVGHEVHVRAADLNSGNIGTWSRLYTTEYKPTAADVGAYTTAQVDAIETGLQNQINTLDGEVVKTSGDQTISGNKTFSTNLITTTIRQSVGADQGMLMFGGGSTRIGGSGSVAGIQLRPNGLDVASDTDYFSFQPGGLVEYEGTSNFGVSRAGGQHGTFAYADGRTFLSGDDNDVEIRPRGLSDSSRRLVVQENGSVVQEHSGGAAYTFQDAVSSGTGSSSYFQWTHDDATRRGFIGFSSSANENMTWFNDNGNANVVLRADGNVQMNTGAGDTVILSGTTIANNYQASGAAGGSWGHSISPGLKITGTDSNFAYNMVQIDDTGPKIQALGEGGNTMRFYPEGGNLNFTYLQPNLLRMAYYGTSPMYMDLFADQPNVNTAFRCYESNGSYGAEFGYDAASANNEYYVSIRDNNVVKRAMSIYRDRSRAIFNTNRLDVESSGAEKMLLYRSDGDANVNVRYSSNSGIDVWAGKTLSSWAVGDASDLSSSGNQWFVIGGSAATFRVQVNLVGDPTASNHAARKAYVDSVASDERLKSNIHSVDDALSIVNQIPVHTYLKEVVEHNEETEQDEVVHKFEYGFIAQEMEEVLPHLVTEREDGMKTILRTGNDLHALSFGSIQQLKAENDELKAKNQELEERLAAIEAKLGL